MKGILVLLSMAVFCHNILLSHQTELSISLQNDKKSLEALVNKLVFISHKYTIESMTLFHSKVALLGISSLTKKLAEEKMKMAHTIMDYLIKRKLTNAKFFMMEIEKSNDLVITYRKSAEYALRFLNSAERNLKKDIDSNYKSIEDTHIKHFLAHTIMEAQEDQLARIFILYRKMKDRGNDKVYSFEFDRYVNFFYENVFINPTENSIHF